MTQEEFEQAVALEKVRWPAGSNAVGGGSNASSGGLPRLIGAGLRAAVALFGGTVPDPANGSATSTAPRPTELQHAMHSARIDTAFVSESGALVFACDDGVYIGTRGRLAMFDADEFFIESVAYLEDRHAIRFQIRELVRDRRGEEQEKLVVTDVALPPTMTREEGESRGVALGKLAFNVKQYGGG